jgi:hypothetical protein
VCGIEKGIVFDHVFRHIVCPFEDLGADVDQNGIRGPLAEDHNLGHTVIHQEESPSCSRADGFIPDVEGAKAEGIVAAKIGTNKLQEMPDKANVNK